MSGCSLCPRKCGADRTSATGFCGVSRAPRVSLVMRHMWEEPCICGGAGAGAVFFSGCQLRCVFCQNAALSRGCAGEDISVARLSEIFAQTAESGVASLDLVTPTHFTPQICEALSLVKDRIKIPVVWNSSGYESPETLAMTSGLVDIYMPDFKFASSAVSLELCGVSDYAARAAEAVAFMYRQLGPRRYSAPAAVRPSPAAPPGPGAAGPAPEAPAPLLRRGLLVRHLCLPGRRRDSLEVLRILSETVPPDGIVLSLMSQYTPDFYSGSDRALHRRLTTFEYDSVVGAACDLGFSGYMQSPGSADSGYTPYFPDRLTVSLTAGL